MGSSIDVSSTGQLVNRLLNPPNPMDQLGKTIEGVNALKSFQANQASADAYRQSVDPQTGEVDLGKYKAIMSQGPGAWNFGPQTQQAGQAVGAVGQGTTADVNAKMAQLGAMGQLMYPLLKAGADNNNQIDPAAVQTQLDRAHAAHLVSDQQYQVWSGQLKGMTPGDAYGFVLGANMGNQEAYRQLGGNVTGINTGPQTVFKQTSPLGAQPPASSTTQMGLSPEGALKLQSYLAEPYDYTDKNGVEHRGGTKADFYASLGINPFKAFTDGTVPAPGSPPAIPQPPAPPQGGGGGSTPGAGNWEVQHNNFAGMRNPNVPAAGGPNTNPAGWQQFATPEEGIQAISNQLDRYASGATTGKPLNTLNGIISTWAPPSENNTALLIRRASQIMGVSPDQPLDLANPQVKAKLVEAMIRNEQGGALPPAAAAAIPKVFPAEGAISQGRATTGATEAVPAAVAKDSGEQFKAARANATQFEARTSGLSQALGLLRQNENLSTGPGTQDLQNLQGIANAWGIDLPKAMKDSNTAFSEINKDLERYYMTLPGAQRSDLAQAEQKMANPSAQTQQREALDDLITRTIGLERMNNAAYLNFEQAHGRQASIYAPQYADESAQYMQNLDPVGFAFNLMTPAERTTYRNSLKGSALANYYKSIKEASRLYNLPIAGE